MIIVIDIDNTLADATWREGLIQEEGWDAFHYHGFPEAEHHQQ